MMPNVPANRDLISPSAACALAPLANCAEWLDKHRWLTFALLAAIPFLVLLPLWIWHLSADPIWYYSGAVKDVHPGLGIVGTPFRDRNVGWTSQALGHLAAWQWLHGKVPWWNPYSGIGMPLAGEMQPGAFFLPFVFLLLLHNGFLWLRVAMQLIAGFSTYALLRQLKVGPLAALVGGILFELNGTFAFTTGPDSVFCAAAFLPLILFGIEQLVRREHERLGTLWIALGIAFSLLAGFPEVAYIDGLLAFVWFLCRLGTLPHRMRFALRAAWGCLLGLLLAGPVLAGFVSLLRQSSAFAIHPLGLSFLHATSLPSIFVPYILGPFPEAPGVGRFGPWDAGGYAGLVLLFFALAGLQARKPLSLRILLAAWVAVAWMKDFGFKPVMEIVNHVPVLLQTQFFRYVPSSWILCLIILAAFGLDELRHRKPRLILPVLGTLAALAVSIHIAWPWRSFFGLQPAEITRMSKYFVAALGWSLAGILCAWLLLTGPLRESRRTGIAAILVASFAAFFTIPVLTSIRPGSVDRAAVRFLQTHLGLSRYYTIGNPLQPNYGAYFRTASLNYTAFPVSSVFTNYIKHHIFPPLATSMVLWSPLGLYDANPGLKYLWEFFPDYQALGVKYVVTDSGGPDELSPESRVPVGDQARGALVLMPGQQAQFSFVIPPLPSGSGGNIRSIAISLGNYSNTSDGKLRVQICNEGHCSKGTRPLSDSADNSFFYIPLSATISVSSGAAAAITVTHEGGSKPVALWISAALPDQKQNLVGPAGKPMAGDALNISFAYESISGALPKVYHDFLMDIFETPHPEPYYSVSSGGPCRLEARKRDSLHAVCDAPAVLVRRELYMPGWHAFASGKRIEAKPYRKIFESFDLPQGDSYLRFAYVPPYAKLAAVGTLAAIVALIADFVFFRRKQRPNNCAA